MRKSAREFQTSKWMTKKAKNLFEMHRILSSPNPQLSKTTEDKGNSFMSMTVSAQ
jgi:hypothetical protein